MTHTQEILYMFSTQNPWRNEVRENFQFGLRGAPKFSEYEMEMLNTFYRITTSYKRPSTIVEFLANYSLKVIVTFLFL